MEDEANGKLSARLEANEEQLSRLLGQSTDLVSKRLQLGEHTELNVFYIDGLIDNQLLHNSILYSLQEGRICDLLEAESPERKIELLSKRILLAGDVTIVRDYVRFIHDLLSGNVMIMVEGSAEALRIGLPGWEDRNVSEPNSQSVVRGPMEGFTENLRTNTALIRRKIKDSQLWLETMQIGRVTQTSVSIMYLKHIANPELVEEVKRRLDAIDTDSILESGYIEEFIQDTVATPFPTIYNSDRPDTIAGGILEGKVAILVDGTPFVLLAPTVFVSFFQSAEDYYQRADISSLLRWIRFLAFFLTMFAPAFYVAITTYHQEMIPTNLVISLAAQRETVPFPAFVEAVMMELTYEILREAGVRIPKNVGQAVSIVGTLVIGQAAVAAGFISSAMVIIVSITAISSFVIPEAGMSVAARMIRFVLIMLAGFMGLYGILCGVFVLVLHLVSLRSFGVPYMSPIGPFVREDLKDSIFRLTWPLLRTRPRQNRTQNLRRQAPPKRGGS
ncbi:MULTISPECIES: spore germination protein [unclassified Paenibacillus]|uniref:spore germination protein n=1 Tax=unclassified Paenibacillus TaxID=185978 RepID=UPI0003E1DCB4|nr:MULTISPECIES: spore germination protein [unclassified Paenibacillus]ETT42421.1 spore germination protein ka [Paenibacillus sp. FSL R7-269]OMF93052.1 spore germination protein [Paenibacillus sp. FSL R7-0337]